MNVRLVLSMTLIKGFRVGTLSSFISILIFSAAMNETANSINSFISQLPVLLSGFVYGSLITPAIAIVILTASQYLCAYIVGKVKY